MKKRKAWKIILPLVIIAILAIGFLYHQSQQATALFEEEVARTQDIETFYTFTGNPEPGSARTVVAFTRGTVKEWSFAEGDQVKEEDVVLVAKNNSKTKAPMDGTISDLYLDPGDDYMPGDPLFRVADYAHPQIRIKVDEYDVSALRKGMPVDVRVQATGAELTGEITRIAQEATVVNDLAYYEVIVEVPQDGTLVMGLTCEISAPRQSAKNATTVSIDAIQYDDEGRPFVYCYSRGNEIVEQRVILGINNGKIVEIKEGVKSGETVLVPPSFGFMLPMMQIRNSR